MDHLYSQPAKKFETFAHKSELQLALPLHLSLDKQKQLFHFLAIFHSQALAKILGAFVCIN